MSSTSESSFGARLLRAKNLASYITNFTGYNPPRPEESIVGFTALLTAIESVNAKETNQQQDYTVAVHNRQNAFRKKTGSIDKLLSPIKGAVDAQFGKSSTESQAVTSIIKSMRATALIKSPTDPGDTNTAKTFSQSERSYGSITQYFKDITNTLSQMPAYIPSNAALQVANLQLLAAQLDSYNSEVAKNIQPLRESRAKRVLQYTDLQDRVQRIKSYVKAEYGNNSIEYNQIKGLKI